MKVFYAVALLAVVAAASSTESQKATAAAVPSPVQPLTTFSGPGGIPYPHLQGNQFTSEYGGPLARSSFGPKAAVPSSAFAAYQPYQHHQQYNFGSHQQYYPASGYPAVGPYPTAYSAQQSTGAAYPSQYSAYPYSAQPYSGGSYSPYAAAAFPSYYGGQFGVPSAAPYNGHYSGAAAPTVTPYSALPSGYQQQPQQQSSSFYNSGQQYGPSQQYLSQPQYPSQQYQSFYANSPATPATGAAADQVKASAEKQ